MEHDFSLRKFLRQFRSVRVLRMYPFISFIREVGLSLQQDDSIFPVLEEIEVSISPLTNLDSKKHQRLRAAKARAGLERFVSARSRAGRPVKVTIEIRSKKKQKREMRVLYPRMY